MSAGTGRWAGQRDGSGGGEGAGQVLFVSVWVHRSSLVYACCSQPSSSELVVSRLPMDTEGICKYTGATHLAGLCMALSLSELVVSWSFVSHFVIPLFLPYHS